MTLDPKTFADKINQFTGISPKKIDALNKTITVIITAGDRAPSGYGDYVLFGGNIYGFSQNAGSDSGITITVQESSHAEVKRETANSPWIIEKMMWSTSNNDNLQNNIVYGQRDFTGFIQQEQSQPLNYAEPEQFYSTNRNIRIPDFNGLVIDGTHAFTGRIQGNSVIRMIFTLKAKIERANMLEAQNIIEMADPTKINPLKVEPINSDKNETCQKYSI